MLKVVAGIGDAGLAEHSATGRRDRRSQLHFQSFVLQYFAT
jgi:hypothetical protein